MAHEFINLKKIDSLINYYADEEKISSEEGQLLLKEGVISNLEVIEEINYSSAQELGEILDDCHAAKALQKRISFFEDKFKENLENEEIVSDIVSSVIEIDTVSALSVLNSILKQTPHEDIKSQIIGSLNKIQPPEALDLLHEIAKNNSDESLRDRAVNSLAHADDPASNKLLMNLALNERNEEIRTSAVYALRGKHIPQLEDFLLKILEKEKNPVIRIAILDNLPYKNFSTILELMKIAEADPDQAVRLKAMAILGKKQIIEAFDLLTKIVKTEPDGIIKVAALLALLELDFKLGDLNFYKKQIESPQNQEERRIESLIAIGNNSFHELVPFLNKVAETDPSEEVRKISVVVLSYIQSIQAIDTLKNVAQTDPSPIVRKRAVWALAGIGSWDIKKFLFEKYKEPSSKEWKVLSHNALVDLAENSSNEETKKLVLSILKKDRIPVKL